MKRISLLMVVLLILPTMHAQISEGFYAEYKVYKDQEFEYAPCAFALLREHKEWDIKYIYIDDMVYKYQVLDVKGNTATIRICFEGEIYTDVLNDRGEYIFFPFKRIFDIKVDLDTMEMIDENDNPWGKWLFWIKPASYNWRAYMFMKNWNDHGEVKVWLRGPRENKKLSSFLKSSYAKTLTHYFYLSTYKTEGDTWIYPIFTDYGISTSYKAYETEEKTIRTEKGGYCLFPPSFNNIKAESGLITRYYYTDEGLFFENTLPYYIDDFIDQKLGIIVLELDEALILTDYGVKDKILIEDPKPEYQKPSFEDEVKRIEQLIEQYAEYNPQWAEFLQGSETPSETPITETPEKTETPQKSELKSETQLPTTTQPNNTEKNNTLFYVAPLLVVAFIAVFLVLKEKR